MGSNRLFDYSDSLAVLIGTSEYQYAGFPPLPAADNSLEGMWQILTEDELCGWPARQVKKLSNESDNRHLGIKLSNWARKTTGVFLLYYVGHGIPGGQGPCLTLTDTQWEHTDHTSLDYGHVRRALLESPAKVKIVILDCCFAGRAASPSLAGEGLDAAGIKGTYVLAAADHAAHVPEDQDSACTSFTGELLELVRNGISDGPGELTLDDIYPSLRTRLRELGLPEARCRGTDTAGTFRFTRNAAFRQGPPLERFPQGTPPEASPDASPEVPQEQVAVHEVLRETGPAAPLRRSWRRWSSVAVAAVALAGATAYTVSRVNPAGLPCGPGAGTPALPGGSVVIGSDLDADPENQLIADIYRDALRGQGIAVDPNITPSLRAAYYGQVCSGAITIVPEYNGALLTTSVDQSSTAITSTAVDSALAQDLPPSLAILDPAPAQDKDSVTVTQATARKYNLKSIADLRRWAGKLTLGASVEFDGREQGTSGLKSAYGVAFGNFQTLDYSGNSDAAVTALLQNEVDAADVYTTNPQIKDHELVVLTDPKGLFRAENVVPLVYKPALRANPEIATILDFVSLRLTQPQLLTLNVEAEQPGASIDAIAAKWSQANLGASG
jgi:osmoprotectant transport system substrate-binding protein